MKTLISFFLLSWLSTGMLLAQGAAPLPAGDQGVDTRLNQLEAETQALRSEVELLREHPARLPAVTMMPTGMSYDASLENAADAAPAAGQEEYYTLDQLRGEMKKLAWKKGDFSIVPYGWLWGNSVYSTERTTPGSYTLWAQSASTQPESEFIVDARNTRLGFDIGGPKVPFFCNAASGGKVEIDFQSPLTVSANNTYDNRPTVLLRHLYGEVKNEEFRFLFGQTWDVISPLNPGMLMYSVGWDGGNIGYRRPQVRLERYLAFSDASLVTVQTSINQMVFEDTTTTIQGETANWPILEGRVGWTVGERGKGALPITVGMSGHVGNEQFDYKGVPAVNNVTRPTWSANLDLRVPLTERLGFQAEAFTGANLGAFLGGIGQGTNPVTLDPVRASGGWVEIWYDWTPRLHSHVGYSVDNPVDQDVVGITNGKSYNQVYWGNLSYDLTKQFLVGVEVSSWKTVYVGQLPGDSVRTEFVAKYGF